jgi:hypothetical protein
MAKAYPKDPWRLAWLDAIQAECRLAQGEAPKARALLQTSAPVIAKRWPRDSLYVARTIELVDRANRARRRG